MATLTEHTTMTATTTVSPVELRHITSNTNLASPARERRLSNRNSQHLRTHRIGSRSPASIPSSPTSVHSSSSAIFERDIEPIAPPAPHLSSDPHRIPRGKATEQMEQAVPSVLDSAVEILASTSYNSDDFDSISIVAPAPIDTDYQSGFTSPNSRLSSRSPSPTGYNNRKSLLFTTSPMPGSPPKQHSSPPTRPIVQTNPVPLPAQSSVAATPTSVYVSAVTDSDPSSTSSSPTTATHVEHPLHTLPTHAINIPAPFPSLPPSPKAASKRLSFLSYIDILSSTPASTLPLSSLTSSAVVSEPPPHIPSVIGLPQAQYAASSSGGSITGSPAYVLERDNADRVADDVGGEWEREGLGKGLEERLEALRPVTSKA